MKNYEEYLPYIIGIGISTSFINVLWFIELRVLFINTKLTKYGNKATAIIVNKQVNNSNNCIKQHAIEYEFIREYNENNYIVRNVSMIVYENEYNTYNIGDTMDVLYYNKPIFRQKPINNTKSDMSVWLLLVISTLITYFICIYLMITKTYDYIIVNIILSLGLTLLWFLINKNDDITGDHVRIRGNIDDYVWKKETNNEGINGWGSKIGNKICGGPCFKYDNIKLNGIRIYSKTSNGIYSIQVCINNEWKNKHGYRTKNCDINELILNDNEYINYIECFDTHKAILKIHIKTNFNREIICGKNMDKVHTKEAINNTGKLIGIQGKADAYINQIQFRWKNNSINSCTECDSELRMNAIFCDQCGYNVIENKEGIPSVYNKPIMIPMNNDYDGYIYKQNGSKYVKLNAFDDEFIPYEPGYNGNNL